jgi:hypothetical protein
MCNIPINFCNILMKHLQYTSKTSETFKIYSCNLYRISVRPPPPSASGHCSHSRRRVQKASAPGPDASPCVAASVASWRPMERLPRVGVVVPALSSKAGRREEAVGRCGGAREGAARGDRQRWIWLQSRSSGAADGARASRATVDMRSIAEQVSRLVLLFLSNRRRTQIP